jgi:hypothetical protein
MKEPERSSVAPAMTAVFARRFLPVLDHAIGKAAQAPAQHVDVPPGADQAEEPAILERQLRLPVPGGRGSRSGGGERVDERHCAGFWSSGSRAAVNICHPAKPPISPATSS